MAADKRWVDHRTRTQILMLIILRDTVQGQLYPLPLLRRPLEELAIPRIIIIGLMGSDSIEIHVLRFDTLVLLRRLL